MTEAVARKGRRLDARYTLLDKLGAGGQGEVWRAHDEIRGVDIALKVLNPALAREGAAWDALEHEYGIATRLDHPFILKVFPPDRSGDVIVLPMELASGGDLRRLRGAGFLEIIPVLLEIAQALEHAHARGVVHRDLKPGNVLFDARGRARLADFGVAETSGDRAEEADASAATRDTNKHGFSPFTASPAQLRGDPPTPADDIYGLGALAYELLSGYPPYYPHFDKQRAIAERVPPLVPTRQIPPRLNALVMRMLSKESRRRPRTMREVIEELDAALNDTLTFDFEQASQSAQGAPASEPVSEGASSSQTSSPSSGQTSVSAADSRDAIPLPAIFASDVRAANTTDGQTLTSTWSHRSGRDRRSVPDRRSKPRDEPAVPPVREPTRASDLQGAPAGAGADRRIAAADPRRGTPGPMNVESNTAALPAESAPPKASAAASVARTPRATGQGSAPKPPSAPRSGSSALARIDAAIERAAFQSPPVRGNVLSAPGAPSPVLGPITAYPPVDSVTMSQHAISMNSGPMHPTWTEISLAGLPRVARLRPIRVRRWPWVLVGMAAGAAAAAYFWLPQVDPRTLPPEVAAVIVPIQSAMNAASLPGTQTAAAGPARNGVPPAKDSTSPATSTDTPAPAASGPGSPAQADEVSEEGLRTMRQKFDKRVAVLESRGAAAWGGRDFAMARTRAAESVGARDAGNSRMAEERLNTASRLLDSVEAKTPPAMRPATADRSAAPPEQEIAGRSPERARRNDPNDRRVPEGQRRAQNQNGVLALLADAQDAEAAPDYARAAQDYSQALALEPGNAAARAGQARANAAFGDDGYARAVGAGFAALGAGRLDQAHEAFVKARALKPTGAEAAEGLRRVGAALTARGFASMRQRATGLEAQERWDEAEQAYEDMLNADPSLGFAQEGKARSGSRAELGGRLQQIIDHPDRLASPGVREDARSLLETAQAQSPSGPVLRSQIARLQILLPGYDRPVRLSLLSDNSTQIAIPTIGSFGTFSRRDIELRPGKYVVVGTRYGFRDVRREITVAPGQETQTIKVTCSEPI